MARRISKLSHHKIDPERKYFFDANVWLLKLNEPLTPFPSEKIYLEFFEKVLQAQIPICVHSLLVSEIFNRVLRLSFEKYKKELSFDPANQLSTDQIKKLDFKRDYRITEAYKFSFESLKSEFLAYSDSLKSIDQQYDFNPKHMVENLPNNVDFNDYVFYEIALALSLTIVTHDSDFKFDTVSVLTQNTKLLK